MKNLITVFQLLIFIQVFTWIFSYNTQYIYSSLIYLFFGVNILQILKIKGLK